MDINQIIFIVGVVFLVFILKICPVIFQSKPARYTRFFKKAANVRFPLIKQISAQQNSPPDDLSTEEMIGILALISAKESISHTYDAALRFADMGWNARYNVDFFSKLFSISKRFQNGFWYRESTELMNLGKLLAKKYDFPEWTREFHIEVETIKKRRVSNLNLKKQL